MHPDLARSRQRIWQLARSFLRLLRTLSRRDPITPGSLYLLRRKCGKPSCRCQRGHRHPAWVLTRSERGKIHLYRVPDDQRPALRPLTAEYRRYQRARARLVKLFAQLLVRIDQLAEQRTHPWPASARHPPSRKAP
jgi:hypothetical protein